MKLDSEFLRLPLNFDEARLQQEAAAFEESDWRTHPQGRAGDSTIPLVAAHGDPGDDAVRGPMRPTPHLERCPYIRQVLASLKSAWGRTRLLRIEGDGESHSRVDADYYGSQRVCVHVPIFTRPEVQFLCGGRSLHMAAGECWLFDSWRSHKVLNDEAWPRVHLVAETVGSNHFWELAERATRPFGVSPLAPAVPRRVAFESGAEPALRFESINYPVVMTPWEQECQFASLLEDLGQGPNAGSASAAAFELDLRRFHRRWRELWATYGDSAEGDAEYAAALSDLCGRLDSFKGGLRLPNGVDAVDAVLEWAVHPSHNPDLRPAAQVKSPAATIVRTARKTTTAAEPARSVHSSSMAGLLQDLGVSLLVSTYQAGKLFVVRADGDRLNVHFRSFASPMGVARRGDRLALGALNQVWEFQNQPAVARRLPPEGRHDACYLPRRTHFTGDVRIHEIAYSSNELWIVNTRFSCLCTLDGVHSFVPRWRPPFVSALAPEDRCHLNGLAMLDDAPRYATALGVTNTAGGWRANKRDGGVLLDLPSGEVALRGLSMPHSPRCRDGRLWILESGVGGVGVADLDRGSVEQVARLPGFTRGLDFCGRYAFVGLSQVRESAVFSGLPLTELNEERQCGVWAVDTRSGRIAGFLRFDAGVQEIFAVQVLPNARWPDVVHDDADLLNGSFVLPAETMPHTHWNRQAA